MLFAPFFTGNSWKKLSVSEDHVLRHTSKCVLSQQRPSGAENVQLCCTRCIKKSERIGNKVPPTFSQTCSHHHFSCLPELQHSLHYSFCTFKKSESNPFSPAKNLPLSPSHLSCNMFSSCSVALLPTQPCLPAKHPQLLPGKETSDGMDRNMGKNLEEELLRKEQYTVNDIQSNLLGKNKSYEEKEIKEG